MKVKGIKHILLVIGLFILFIILDLTNLPTLIGMDILDINMDFFGILFDALIVIILYIISYYYIENRQLEKDINSKNTALVLIRKTYEECKSNLVLLENKDIVKKFIIPKIDGDKTDSENKIISNLQTLPFSSFDSIMTLSVNGYITQNELEEYLEIKKDYQRLISYKITFYDLEKPKTKEQEEMYNYIKYLESKIKNIFIKYL